MNDGGSVERTYACLQGTPRFSHVLFDERSPAGQRRYEAPKQDKGAPSETEIQRAGDIRLRQVKSLCFPTKVHVYNVEDFNGDDGLTDTQRARILKHEGYYYRRQGIKFEHHEDLLF